jgi:hydrogenase-1 operon protein HyaF
MSQLREFTVRVGRKQLQAINQAMIDAILKEIMTLLARFLEAGEPGVIDLKSLPRMNAATYQRLKDILATGEVTALVEAEAKVAVRETIYPGVWWLTHHDEEGAIVTELIEITKIPELLASHVGDMRAGLARFERMLGEAARNEASP